MSAYKAAFAVTYTTSLYNHDDGVGWGNGVWHFDNLAAWRGKPDAYSEAHKGWRFGTVIRIGLRAYGHDGHLVREKHWGRAGGKKGIS